MKRKLLTIMALLVSALAQGQVFQQINIVLDSEVPKDKNCVYEASTSIKLLPGLRCDPAFGKSVMFTIDRFGVFPPNEGLYGGPSAGQKGVVGALPGELNISDMGAAVYSVPIMMPQGLGEITPDLAITYNSQAGNGLMGWGWSLSGLSAIILTMPNSFVSAMEIVLISIPLSARSLVSSAILPKRFSTKIDNCVTNIFIPPFRIYACRLLLPPCPRFLRLT